MKYMLLFVLLAYSCIGFAQEIDTTDVFDLDKNYHLILKPEIEKKIKEKIAPDVKKKLREIELSSIAYFELLPDQNKKDEVQFIEDTIRINAFLTEFADSYSMGTTTMGMNWGESFRLEAYDKLLNKFYQKSLMVLKPDMKNKLIESQRRWLNYYTKEKEFIFQLNDFGNHNSSLYNWGYYFEMLEKRVIFLKEIYHRTFNGINVYQD